MDKRKNNGFNFLKNSSNNEKSKVIIRTFNMPTKTTIAPLNSVSSNTGVPADNEKEKWKNGNKYYADCVSELKHTDNPLTREYQGTKDSRKNITGSASCFPVPLAVQPNQCNFSKLKLDSPGLVIVSEEMKDQTPKVPLPKEVPKYIEAIPLNNTILKVGDPVQIVEVKDKEGGKRFYVSPVKKINRIAAIVEKSSNARISCDTEIQELQKSIDGNKCHMSLVSSITDKAGLVQSVAVTPITIPSFSDPNILSSFCVPPKEISKTPVVLVNAKLTQCSEITQGTAKLNINPVVQSFNGDSAISNSIVNADVIQSEKGILCKQTVPRRETGSNHLLVKPVDALLFEKSKLKRRNIKEDSVTQISTRKLKEDEPVPNKQAKLCSNSTLLEHAELKNLGNEKQISVVLRPGDVPELPVALKKLPYPESNIPKIYLKDLKNAELFRKRQQIALQFQKETLRARDQLPIIDIIDLPARRVCVSDVSTQTSLFSLLESGRMVEMFMDPDVPENSRNEVESPGRIVCVNETSSLISESYHDVSESSKMISSVDDSDSDCTIDVSESNSAFERNNLEDLHIFLEKETGISNTLAIGCKILAGRNFKSFDIPDDSPSTSYQETRAKYKLLQVMWRDFKSCISRDENGNLPIHNAVLDEDVRQVKKQCIVLLTRKMSIDVENADGETPLRIAVFFGNLDIVKELMKCGANPGIQDEHGNSVLHVALKCCNLPLFMAIIGGVRDGSPILNQYNKDGFCPLHLCAIEGKEVEATVLIGKGAYIDVRDKKFGRTPIFLAMERNNIKMARQFKDLGANLTIRDYLGKLPKLGHNFNSKNKTDQILAGENHISRINEGGETSTKKSPQGKKKKKKAQASLGSTSVGNEKNATEKKSDGSTKIEQSTSKGISCDKRN